MLVVGKGFEESKAEPRNSNEEKLHSQRSERASGNPSLGVECSDRSSVMKATLLVEQLECVSEAEGAGVTACPSLQAVSQEWSPL